MAIKSDGMIRYSPTLSALAMIIVSVMRVYYDDLYNLYLFIFRIGLIGWVLYTDSNSLMLSYNMAAWRCFPYFCLPQSVVGINKLLN